MLGNSVIASLLLSGFVFELARCYSVEKFSILMPNIKPDFPDQYLCTSVKLDPDNTHYIVGFEPNATMDTAHHVFLYGCSKPGNAKPVWNCREMYSSDSAITVASPCQEESILIYTWSTNAPSLILPDGVGFKVGNNSRIQYVVVQVHYTHVDAFKNGRTDDSGITLHLTQEPLNKLAGLYSLHAGGSIRPQEVEYMEVACKLKENKTMLPFAYRIHTHALGKIVAGYVVKNNHEWIELGKRDPVTTQMFYDTQSKVSIHQGDTLAARCTMQSNRDNYTYFGFRVKDEMCSFYILYYVENDEPIYDAVCYSEGPPHYYWKTTDLQNIPDVEASTL